jgi:Domain of unknown function (DUF4367)
MNPFKKTKSTDTPTDSPLVRELTNIATKLDAMFVDSHDLLNPASLRQRQESPMNEFHNEPITAQLDPITPPKKSKAITGMAAALVLGIAGTSAVFLTVAKPESKSKKGLVRTSSSNGAIKYFKPTYIPAGQCLQNANVQNPEDVDDTMMGYQPDQMMLKGPDKQAMTIMAQGMNYGSPESLTGEQIDVNGSPGIFTSKAGNFTMNWKIGKTALIINGREVPKDKLLTIARSITLRFDETGAHIATIDASGFTQTENPNQMSFEGGGTNYIKCGSKPGPIQIEGFSVYSSRPNPLGDDFNFGSADSRSKETPFNVERNGKTIVGKKMTSNYGGQTFTNVMWEESDTAVSVSLNKLSDAELAKIVSGLVPTTADELKALGKTVDPALSNFEDFPTDEASKLKELTTITIGKTEFVFRTGIKDDQLCLSMTSATMSNGSQCMQPNDKPELTSSFGGGPYSVGQVLTMATVTKATATMPDGTTKDIPSFQDARKPDLRIFIYARKTKDPIPTKIQFFDAAGKVVSEQ